MLINGILRLWGDNNCNGALDPIDALYALAFSVLLIPSAQCPAVGDVVTVVFP